MKGVWDSCRRRPMILRAIIRREIPYTCLHHIPILATCDVRSHFCPSQCLRRSYAERAGSGSHLLHWPAEPRGTDGRLGDNETARHPVPTWGRPAEGHSDGLFIPHWDRQVVLIVHHAPGIPPRAPALYTTHGELFMFVNAAERCLGRAALLLPDCSNSFLQKVKYVGFTV